MVTRDSDGVRRLGRELAGLRKDVRQLYRQGVGLGQSSFEGAINQYYGSVIGSSFGSQFDGSNGVYALSGPIPPTPEIGDEGAIEAIPGGLRIRWDGAFQAGQVAPLGFTQLEVHVSDDPLFSGLMFATLKGYITSARGGESVVMLPPNEVGGYYVKIVARTNAGRASLPSVRYGPFEPGVVGADLIDPDIMATLTAASGKNKVTFSTGLPPSTNPDGTAGDLWFQRDIAGSGAKILGVWEWSGTTWLPRTFADSVLASLTVGKLVSGTVGVGTVMTIGTPGGARIEISGSVIQQLDASGTITFQLSPGGATLFRGTLTGQSTNFVEGTAGWRLEEDGDAFLQSVQVAENLTAKTASFTNLNVGGIPIQSMIDAKPRGLVAAGFDGSAEASTSLGVEVGHVELGFTAYPNRSYQVHIRGGAFATDDGDTYANFALRATTDGSAPTISSPFVTLLNDQTQPKSAAGGDWPWRQLNFMYLYYPLVTNPVGQQVRLLLTMSVVRGFGTASINNTKAQMDFWIEDIGPRLANSMRVNNSKASSPPPAPPTPVQTYDVYWPATWSASYRANNSRWSEGDKMYQGYGDSFNGNQVSMIGFDTAGMRARLAGATIRQAFLYVHNWHTWSYSGGTAWLGTHNQMAMPATYPGGSERRLAIGTSKGGWIGPDITSWVAEIRDGTTAGVLLGRAPDNNNANYGYWYGANYGQEAPSIRVIFDK